jgi:hypothetical protein
MDKRKFIASSDIFSDFTVEISLYQISTIDDIIQKFKEELVELLQKHTFTMLLHILENKEFHIHTYTIDDILSSKIEQVFYICDHH